MTQPGRGVCPINYLADVPPIQLIGMDILNVPPKVLFEALPAELAQFGQTWVHHSELPLSLLNELSTYTCRHRGLTERR